MGMSLAEGSEEYAFAFNPVRARGASFTDDEIDDGLRGPVGSLVWDDVGDSNLEAMLTDLTTTEFSQERVREVLKTEPIIEDWRVGEAFAEAFLVEHRSCEFPWPMGRDLRNPS